MLPYHLRESHLCISQDRRVGKSEPHQFCRKLCWCECETKGQLVVCVCGWGCGRVCVVWSHLPKVLAELGWGGIVERGSRRYDRPLYSRVLRDRLAGSSTVPCSVELEFLAWSWVCMRPEHPHSCLLVFEKRSLLSLSWFKDTLQSPSLSFLNAVAVGTSNFCFETDKSSL